METMPPCEFVAAAPALNRREPAGVEVIHNKNTKRTIYKEKKKVFFFSFFLKDKSVTL
jgi:hypothetical protein